MMEIWRLTEPQHTKHHLEGLHENINVFRHPDHVPSGQELSSELKTTFSNLSLGAFSLAKLPGETLKTLYGTHDDVVLFWSHHEKLCVVDHKIAFMGGLDACELISSGSNLRTRV